MQAQPGHGRSGDVDTQAGRRAGAGWIAIRRDGPLTAMAPNHRTDEPFDYRTITPDGIRAAAEAGIVAAEALIAEAAEAAAADDVRFADVVGRIDRAEGDLWTVDGRTGFMVRVHPDADVRAAGQAIEERLNAWRQDLVLRDDIATAIRTYADSTDAASLTGEERRLLDLWLRDLRRAGHGLPAEERAEIKAITERIVVLESSFQRNLDEWSDGIDLERNDLVGLPDAYIDRLGPRDRARDPPSQPRLPGLLPVHGSFPAARLAPDPCDEDGQPGRRSQSADPRRDAGPAPPQGAAPRLSILGALPDRTEDGGDPGARGGLPRRDPPGAPDARGGGIRDDARSPRARYGRDRPRAMGHPLLRPADPDRGVRGRPGRGLRLSAAGGHDRRAPRI